MAGRTSQDWLDDILNMDASSDSSTSAGSDIAMPSMILAPPLKTRSCCDDYILSEEIQLQMKRDMLRRCKSLEARTKPLWP